MTENDELDTRLRRALRTSPWPDTADGLAARARAIARAREAEVAALRARLDAQRQRTRILNIAAMVLIVVETVGILSQVSWHDMAFASEPAISSTEGTESTEAIWLPDEAALLLICGGLLLAALVWVAVEPASSHIPRPFHPLSG